MIAETEQKRVSSRVRKESGPKLRPEALARESAATLKSQGDPARAAGQRRYFKEQVEFLGLTTPRIREVEADLWGRVRSRWALSDATAFTEAMLGGKYFEIRALGLMLLLRFKKEFPAEFPSRVRRWLAADKLDNWALVDVFCPPALGPFLEKDPGFAAEIQTWTKDRNRWVKRASAVSFINLARRGACLEAVYDIASRLFPVDDDLIHKATGWLLREAGKTDRPRLRAFLLKHGPSIPRTALRYAVEKFPEPERLDLLARTKKG
jgi:3-methyladenine DNA glycosylase AlkD